jgi:hypothetical protein
MRTSRMAAYFRLFSELFNFLRFYPEMRMRAMTLSAISGALG